MFFIEHVFLVKCAFSVQIHSCCPTHVAPEGPTSCCQVNALGLQTTAMFMHARIDQHSGWMFARLLYVTLYKLTDNEQ